MQLATYYMEFRLLDFLDTQDPLAYLRACQPLSMPIVIGIKENNLYKRLMSYMGTLPSEVVEEVIRLHITVCNGRCLPCPLWYFRRDCNMGDEIGRAHV